MPSWTDLLGQGGQIGEQLLVWGVLNQVVGALLNPTMELVNQDLNTRFPEVPLSPAVLAALVVRGYLDEPTAAGQAVKSGVDGDRFHLLVEVGRNPIAPQEAAAALRRQMIPLDAAPGQPSFNNAIAEGDTGDQWADTIRALATQIPSPADILQAVLQGQVPAGVDPRALYERCGGMATDNSDQFDWFTLMFNTRGSAPTPMEALEMVNRGILPLGDGSDGQPKIEGPGALSYWQAFLEGPWRNKWEPAFAALREYFPPPRSVVAMLHNGSITPAQATVWLQKQGLAPETIAAYIADATRTKTATPKNLSVSQVHQLLVDKLIDTPTAVTMLEKLGYDQQEATVLATTAQAAQTIADVNANVTRVRGYYVAHKINRATAQSELGALGLPPDRVESLLAGWDVARSSNVRTLTAAQIENAWEYGLLTEAEALQELQILGYTALDAWILLSIKAKQALPNRPAGLPGLTP